MGMFDGAPDGGVSAAEIKQPNLELLRAELVLVLLPKHSQEMKRPNKTVVTLKLSCIAIKLFLRKMYHQIGA